MNYRTIHPQFKATFSYHELVPDGIQETLWNYLAYGLPPGGFVESVLENNFLMASCRADSFWDAQGFRQLAKWIMQYMPIDSHGTKEKIAKWMKLSDEVRCEIMVELRLRPGIFEILAGTAEA